MAFRGYLFRRAYQVEVAGRATIPALSKAESMRCRLSSASLTEYALFDFIRKRAARVEIAVRQKH